MSFMTSILPVCFFKILRLTVSPGSLSAKISLIPKAQTSLVPSASRIISPATIPALSAGEFGTTAGAQLFPIMSTQTSTESPSVFAFAGVIELYRIPTNGRLIIPKVSTERLVDSTNFVESGIANPIPFAP